MKVIRNSILLKILMGVIIPVIVSLCILLFFVLNIVKNEVDVLTKENLNAKSSEASYQVSEFLTQYQKTVEAMAEDPKFEAYFKATVQGVPITQTPGFDEMKSYLLNVANHDSSNILACWIGDFDSSQLTQSDGFTSGPEWDITTRAWYKAVTAEKKAIITEPYIDSSTKKLIVSAAAPVYDKATNQMIGVVGLDLTLDHLSEIMGKYKLGQTGFFSFLSKDGIVIFDKDKENQMKSITEIALSKEVIGVFDSKTASHVAYQRDGKNIYGYYSLIGDTGWSVLSSLPEDEYYQAYDNVAKLSMFLIALILVILVVIIVLMSKGIIKPLKHLSIVANQIAEGDLNVEIEHRSKDEIGQVGDAFEKTVVRLKEYVNYIDEVSYVLNQIAMGNMVFDLKYDYIGEFSKIKDAMLKIQSTFTETLTNIAISADQVASGSDQVASGSQALSQGAMEQASSIEELSATINEISEHIKNNAGNANLASKLAIESSQEVERGSDQMKDLIIAMDEISGASNQISKIIKTIDDIAFQTNILALNAAVEAARAGAAGKGFAVVADEVRNLAQKSADAAKTTTELIESAIHAVGNGKNIMDETAQSLDKIVVGVKQATGLINQISEASNEQAESINEVTVGVDQISSVVQTNSATAEESAAASEELSAQAQMLKELVGQFQLEASAKSHENHQAISTNFREDEFYHKDETMASKWDMKY